MSKETAKPEIKRADLILVGNELNALLDPDPKIKTVAVKADVLTAAIIKAAELIEAGDKLTPMALTVLKNLDVELPERIEVVESFVDETEDPAEVEITEEVLLSLVAEMNTVMELDPPLAIAAGTDLEEMKTTIRSECYDKDECQVFDTDKFTDTAWATLKTIGVVAVVTKKAKKEKAEKPAKAAKEPKTSETKKDETERTALGSKVGTQAAMIDLLLIAAKKPITAKYMAEKTELSTGRIKMHIDHLEKKKGIKFIKSDDGFMIESK